MAPMAPSQGQQPLRFTSPPEGCLWCLTVRSQDALSRPSYLLSHPFNKVLLCSEHRHCIFFSILKILQCRKLRDVESFCQGLVDSGIDSCKDTRALGWGRGQPCTTASDTVLAEQRNPGDSPNPHWTCWDFTGQWLDPGLICPKE